MSKIIAAAVVALAAMAMPVVQALDNGLGQSPGL
jgi:hypothetical protein